MSIQCKPRVRVTWDAHGVIQWPILADTAALARTVQRSALPIENPVHVLGGQCPHCGGSGRYLNHQRRCWGKCFRCDGKGVLDPFDIALLRLRLNGGGPVCQIFGGTPRLAEDTSR